MNSIRGERLINSAIAGFHEIYLGKGGYMYFVGRERGNQTTNGKIFVTHWGYSR